jgi:hypothetical protein
MLSVIMLNVSNNPFMLIAIMLIAIMLIAIMLIAIMLIAIMLIAIMLIAIMLSVVAPLKTGYLKGKFKCIKRSVLSVKSSAGVDHIKPFLLNLPSLLVVWTVLML